MSNARTTSEHQQSTWGIYRPKGINKVLLSIVRLGLSHGKIKNAIQYLWNTKECSVVDINYHNVLLRCSLGTNNIEGRILFSSKFREKKELSLLKPFLKDGGVFLDIGANVGYYSLMAAKMGARKVLSFEPNKTVRERLQFNRDANGLQEVIDILPVALGNKEHTTTMTCSSTDLGAGTLVQNCVEGETFPVLVQRIDTVLAEKGINRIDALKIDVEGYEDEALLPLLGCSDELMPKFIIIEHAHINLWKKNIIELLTEHHYLIVGSTRSNTFLKYLK